ncbi:hypothetical protein O0I10_008009 [Lichtheimia ornata]|uniref:Yeast cell wall synthesis Kre9/Knh1-like N-terminal domain-containing protein n=1 Tax=Lichtheimia ornata TaxID=688661 RepID=A0AAD7UZS6_9FUNG|nr:uncharacterized protein O0I10_008009 [Lichtheimia ornata]KAJ8656215.1 hypothetical protein O0I10_008009 [Lichtheimia ornata]
MKSFLLSAATLAAIATNAAATITVIAPWGSDVWNAGGQGNITWKHESADANLDCEIQMMNGNSSNSNMVAYITDPKSPVKCSADAFNIYPLNDFGSGDYWIRIGQSDKNNWAYSGVFKFKGNGTAKPYHLASNGASVAAAAATSGSAAASGKSASSSASASKAAQSDSPDENAAGRLEKTMAAALGGALVVAATLVL